MSSTNVSGTGRRIARGVAAALLACIAAYDVVIGAQMLWSAEPWRMAGDDTLWAGLGALEGDLSAAVEAAMRRIGAFSLLAGLFQLGWIALSWRDRRFLTALLALQLAIGPVFYWIDQTWFQNTAYLSLKSFMGAAWVVALVLHAASWRES